MKDYIIEAILTLLLGGLCAIGAYLLMSYKQSILKSITDLVQKVEGAVEGSKLGETKKDLVIAQLQAAGIKVTGWVSTSIDRVVRWLNTQNAWLIDKSKQGNEEAKNVIQNR